MPFLRATALRPTCAQPPPSHRQLCFPAMYVIVVPLQPEIAMTQRVKSLSFASLFLAVFLFANVTSAQAVSFTHKIQSGQTSRYHADFNNDGWEDFVFPAPGGFEVELSNAGGTYSAPVFYPLRRSVSIS